MTERIPLDHLTSDALDQLYAEIGRLEIANRALNTAVLEAVERAERAETERDALRRMLAPEDVRLVDEMVTTIEQHFDRAARAEAALTRVRKACDSVRAADQGHNAAVGWVVMRVLEAIDARLVNGTAPASDAPCPGFPDQCPNPQPVPARSPYHGGGVRCGCTNPKES